MAETSGESEIMHDLRKIANETGVAVDGLANIDYSAVDSIMFISFIAEVERFFDIVFPEEMLRAELLKSLAQIETIITEALTC